MMEAVIAIGILATAIPLVFSALSQAARSELAARAETRSIWVARACIDEIRASRGGFPRYLAATTSGQSFPPPGEIWALAFSRDGQLLGSLTRPDYQNGTRQVAGQAVRYIASLGSSLAPSKSGMPALLRVHISVEYPAVASAAQRRKITFHTLLP